ncbi:MAG: lysylphosphatidylglycerol synthase transmembrane domain-containing protein [Candidatus Bilamarchaeaceae archaeon]
MNKRNNVLLLINAFISIILVIALLYYAGIGDVFKNVERINLFYLFLAGLSLIAVDFAMAFRIKVMLEGMAQKTAFLNILKSHFVGMLTSNFTPARAGYFATAANLRLNYKIKSESALLSIFGPQIYDFTVKIVFGAIALVYLLNVIGERIENNLIAFLGVLVLSLMVAIMLLLLFSKKFLLLFSFSKSIPFVCRVYAIFERMQEHSHHLVRNSSKIIGLTAISFIAKALEWFFIAKACSIELNVGFPEILFFFLLQPLVTILDFIPFLTIAGLGLTEGANILVLGLFGVSSAQALLFSLLTRFMLVFVHLPAIGEALKIYSAK